MEKGEFDQISAYRDKQVKDEKLLMGKACGLILAPRGEGYKLEPYLATGQQCHIGILLNINKSNKFVELAFSVGMDERVANVGKSDNWNEELYVYNSWLDYLFHQSPFRQVFCSASKETSATCSKKTLIPINLNKAPANVTMAAMICVRHLWEPGISEWPKRFYNFIRFGFSSHLAFLLAPYIFIDGRSGLVKFSTIDGNTNHMLFCPGAIGLDYVNNFCDGRWMHVANETISNGGDYLDSQSGRNPRWNVYSLFADEVIIPSAAMSKRDGAWMETLKKVFAKSPNGMSHQLLQYALRRLLPDTKVRRV